jgi:hypothetical protein
MRSSKNAVVRTKSEAVTIEGTAGSTTRDGAEPIPLKMIVALLGRVVTIPSSGLTSKVGGGATRRGRTPILMLARATVTGVPPQQTDKLRPRASARSNIPRLTKLRGCNTSPLVDMGKIRLRAILGYFGRYIKWMTW